MKLSFRYMHPDETERLLTLNRFDILDSPPEDYFDTVIQMLSRSFRTSMAFISLVGKDHVHLKAKTDNLPESRMGREESICATAIGFKGTTVFSDLQEQSEFSHIQGIDEMGIRFYAGAPLVANGNHIGMVCVADDQPREFTEMEKDLLSDFSVMVMRHIELRLAAKKKTEVLEEMIRERMQALENIREEERSIIAREVHDELGQQLTAIKLDLSWFNRKLPGESTEEKLKLTDTLSMVDNAISTVRKIAAELRPTILSDLGLADALEWLTNDFSKRAEIKLDYYCDCQDIEVPAEIATHYFRITQEALTNIARHSKAAYVTITLQLSDDELVLTITDDGVGFDPETDGKRSSNGLAGIKERIVMMKGNCEILSNAGLGTMIKVSTTLKN